MAWPSSLAWPFATQEDPRPVARRVDVVMEDLVEPARASALEKLDESRQAITIATDWVRRTITRGTVAATETPSR